MSEEGENRLLKLSFNHHMHTLGQAYISIMDNKCDKISFLISSLKMIYYFMHMYFPCMYEILYVTVTFGCQKISSGLLGLEFEKVVRCHVSAR